MKYIPKPIGIMMCFTRRNDAWERSNEQNRRMTRTVKLPRAVLLGRIKQ